MVAGNTFFVFINLAPGLLLEYLGTVLKVVPYWYWYLDSTTSTRTWTFVVVLIYYNSLVGVE